MDQHRDWAIKSTNSWDIPAWVVQPGESGSLSELGARGSKQNASRMFGRNAPVPNTKRGYGEVTPSGRPGSSLGPKSAKMPSRSQPQQSHGTPQPPVLYITDLQQKALVIKEILANKLVELLTSGSSGIVEAGRYGQRTVRGMIKLAKGAAAADPIDEVGLASLDTVKIPVWGRTFTLSEFASNLVEDYKTRVEGVEDPHAMDGDIREVAQDCMFPLKFAPGVVSSSTVTESASSRIVKIQKLMVDRMAKLLGSRRRQGEDEDEDEDEDEGEDEDDQTLRLFCVMSNSSISERMGYTIERDGITAFDKLKVYYNGRDGLLKEVCAFMRHYYDAINARAADYGIVDIMSEVKSVAMGNRVERPPPKAASGLTDKGSGSRPNKRSGMFSMKPCDEDEDELLRPPMVAPRRGSHDLSRAVQKRDMVDFMAKGQQYIADATVAGNFNPAWKTQKNEEFLREIMQSDEGRLRWFMGLGVVKINETVSNNQQTLSDSATDIERLNAKFGTTSDKQARSKLILDYLWGMKGWPLEDPNTTTIMVQKVERKRVGGRKKPEETGQQESAIGEPDSESRQPRGRKASAAAAAAASKGGAKQSESVVPRIAKLIGDNLYDFDWPDSVAIEDLAGLFSAEAKSASAAKLALVVSTVGGAKGIYSKDTAALRDFGADMILVARGTDFISDTLFELNYGIIVLFQDANGVPKLDDAIGSIPDKLVIVVATDSSCLEQGKRTCEYLQRNGCAHAIHVTSITTTYADVKNACLPWPAPDAPKGGIELTCIQPPSEFSLAEFAKAFDFPHVENVTTWGLWLWSYLNREFKARLLFPPIANSDDKWSIVDACSELWERTKKSPHCRVRFYRVDEEIGSSPIDQIDITLEDLSPGKPAT